MGKDKAKKALKRKAKLKKRLQVLNQPAKPRMCGPCMACCVHFAVDGLPGYEGEKPAGEPCKHLTEDEAARCGSYTDRPVVCGAYKCLWLWDGEANNRLFHKVDRPDQSGIIFDFTEPNHPASLALKRPVMIARAVREGALDTAEANKLFDRFLDRGTVIALVRGNMRYEFLASNKRDASIVQAVYAELPKFKVLGENE